MALVFSLSAAGLQNAISKFVAGETATDDYKASLRILLVGFAFSLILSLGCLFGVYHFSDFIAAYLLFEPRCAPLLRIAALSFPFASVHSCVNGYFYGIRKTAVPAATQLTEQIFRVGSVYLIASAPAAGKRAYYNRCCRRPCYRWLSSMLLALPAAYLHFIKKAYPAGRLPSGTLYRKAAGASKTQLIGVYGRLSRQIIGFAAPLSANRLCLNLLQAIEAACIPAKLQVYGHSVSDSLSVYGVLTGMALPLIYFPGTLTNSVSVLLMPAISEADAVNNQNAIKVGRTQMPGLLPASWLRLLCRFFSIGKNCGHYAL